MRIVKCWDIQQWDGGDRTNHAFYVETEEEAKKWQAKNKYDSVFNRTFEIYASVEEYIEGKSETTRKRALAKLTDIERKSLGL